MRYPLLFAASAALCGLTISAATRAATTETAEPVDEIIVLASRLQQTAAETGTSISVLEREDLELLGFSFAVDAIASLPGVTVNQNGAFGGVASVRIRGASSAQTLTLINGVPVNDASAPGGGFDFARLDTANIERIEILRGPQSTLWGTDAIGGVVSITTRQPEPGLAGNLFLEGGSFDTLRGGASIGGANDTGEFRLAATRQDTDGISKADEDNGNREEDGFESDTYTLRLGLNLPAEAKLTADVLWTEADNEFDSFSFGAQGSVADGDELSNTQELTGNLSLSLPLLDGRLNNLLLVGYSDIERENFTNGVSAFSSGGERQLYRYQGNLALDRTHSFAFGVEREETERADQDTTIDGAFLLYEFSPGDALTLTAGVRRDDHDEFGAETTARLAVAYALNDAVVLRGSWGEGFKAPTLFQTTFFCCGAVAPNPNLVPETSESFDLGIDWRGDRASISATLFRQDTEDLIDFSFVAGGYENIAEVESTGAELAMEYRLTNALTASLNYTWLDSEDGNGEPLARLPEHVADLTLALAPSDRWSAAMLVRYNGREDDTDGTELDSWTRVDLTGRYQLTQTVELYGRIENLFDADYQQILGFGTPDRSATVGVRYRF
jgi:vitamin B12 transporter